MTYIAGWLIRYGDIAAGLGERVEPGALRLARPDFEVAAGHGLIPGAAQEAGIPNPDFARRDLIGKGGENAELQFRPDGVLIRCRVLATQAAHDAAELVREQIFGGWSMELVPKRTGRDMGGLNVIQLAYLYGGALVWSPAYRQSTCWLEP